MKKYYRFFGGFIDVQEKWLNGMANRGYRLVDSGKITYTFEECPPNKYQYAIEFIAQRGYKDARDYHVFLEELGYKVLYKNINLNFSIGKAKWRPWGKGAGQISTSPGTYNKELLIVEKEVDGSPFELHTTNDDKADYYRPLRNAWLTITALLLVFALWQFFADASPMKIAIYGIFALLSLIPSLKYQKRASYHAAQAKLSE